MSMISSVAIITYWDEKVAIGRVNEAMAEQTRNQKLEPLGKPEDDFGGHKVPSCYIWGAGYNYLDYGTFVEALAAAQWRDPETVVAWIKDQEYFTVWRPR